MMNQSTHRSGDASRPYRWAAPLGDRPGDRRRALQLLALAGAALRRRLAAGPPGPVTPRAPMAAVVRAHGPGETRARGGSPPGPERAAIEVIEDPMGGRLIVPEIGAAVLLAGLAERLAEVPAVNWPRRIEEHVNAAVDAGSTTAGLRVSRWVDVESLLVVRVVPRSGAGPLAWPLSDGLFFDVVIAPPGCHRPADPLDDEIGAEVVLVLVTPTVDQILGWDRSPDRIRRAARANTRRRLRPTIATAEVGRLRVVVASGGPTTAGALIDIDYFLRRSSQATPSERRSGLVASALNPSLVVAIETPDRTTGSADRLLSGWFENNPGGFVSNRLVVARSTGGVGD